MANIMQILFLILISGVISFMVLVAAIYYGTTLALRSYFGGENVGPRDIMSGAVHIDEDEPDR